MSQIYVVVAAKGNNPYRQMMHNIKKMLKIMGK